MPSGQLQRGRLRTTYLTLMALGLLSFAGALLALYTDQPMGLFSMLLGIGLGVTLAANVMRWAA